MPYTVVIAPSMKKILEMSAIRLQNDRLLPTMAIDYTHRLESVPVQLPKDRRMRLTKVLHNRRDQYAKPFSGVGRT